MDGVTDSIDMNLSKLQEMVKDREAWHAADHGVTVGQDSTITRMLPWRFHSFRSIQRSPH